MLMGKNKPNYIMRILLEEVFLIPFSLAISFNVLITKIEQTTFTKAKEVQYKYFVRRH